MKIINCEQGTQEWHEARRCMITGTKMDSVMGTSLDKLMLVCELIAEEATEQSKVLKPTAEMERGNTEEIFGRKHFEDITKKKVTQIGFCKSDEFDYLGISGDGWIETDGVYTEALEIKSPDSKNAVFYKLEHIMSAQEIGLGSWSKPTKSDPDPIFKPSAKAPFLGIPAKYKWQVVTYFIVNENLKTMNFCIWDPRFLDDASKMHIVKINRDNEELQLAIEEGKKDLKEFKLFWSKCRQSIIADNF